VVSERVSGAVSIAEIDAAGAAVTAKAWCSAGRRPEGGALRVLTFVNTRYARGVSSRDTTPDAMAVQTAVYRRMTSDQRTRLAARMSVMTRAIAMENIQLRHPEYGVHQVRMALYRLLLGDELFRRAWPNEPLLAP